MSNPYAYLTGEETPPPKSKKWIIILIIVLIVIGIIVGVIVFLLTRGSSNSTPITPVTNCTTNNDCAAPNKVCNTSTKTCVQCLANSDCPTNFNCANNKCCSNAAPTITTLQINMQKPAQITGSYTFIQPVANTTAVTQIYDDQGNVLYTQPANNNLGIITVTESETGSVIFANTVYKVGVAIISDCGTSPFSDLVSISGNSCLPTTPSIVSVSGTVTTNQVPSGTPGVSISVTDTTGFFNSFFSPKIGLLVYTQSGTFPNEAQMLVQNLNPINPFTFTYQSGWVGITPNIGTTYYARFYIEAIDIINPSNKCNSILSNEMSFVALA